MALKFYKCEKCGDVAVKVFDAKSDTPCEGTELVANSEEAAVEKHLPVVTVNGNQVHVAVSDVAHPMMEAHFITFIALETKKGYQIVELTPGEGAEAVADFALVDGDAPVAAYEYCNLHGLWKTEI